MAEQQEKDNAEVIVTPEGRMRWIHVFTSKLAYDQVKMVHTVTLLIPKGTDLSDFENAREKTAMAAFKKIPAGLRKITGGQKPILRDGDEFYASKEADKKDMYKEYRGCWYFSPEAPEEAGLSLYGPGQSLITDPADLYDGCYGRLFIRINCYPSKARKGYAGGSECSVELKGLIKTRDGEVLTTKSSAPLTEDTIKKLLGGCAMGAAGPVADDIDDL